MLTYSVFVVDDEEFVREGLCLALGSNYQVTAFENAEDALAQMASTPPDLVLLDIGLPGKSGLEALKEFKRQRLETIVIMITAYEDVDTVISAMKHGAYDYIVKPIHLDGLEVTIRNALETIRLRKEVRLLQAKYLRENVACFLGESDNVLDMIEFLKMVAQSPDTPILILGETGTGKELIASTVHYHSPNYKGNFVTVNCAAIPKDLIESEIFGYEKGAFSGAAAAGKKGLIEDAANGTLFLDEIGDLSLDAQAKLLRFLENGEFYRVGGTQRRHVQTRLVSATNKDLENMIDDGLFRKDLYFRIGVVKLKVPSLNERPKDILLLANYFLDRFSRKFDKKLTGISEGAQAALLRHNWTGNVRELKNLIEKGVLVCQGASLELADLGLEDKHLPVVERPVGICFPPIQPEGVDLTAIHADLEKYYLEAALSLAGGNESKAAKLLNLNHHTYRYRLKKLRHR